MKGLALRRQEPVVLSVLTTHSARARVELFECRVYPSVLGLLAHAYASSGYQTEAGKILDQLMQLSKQRYVSAYSFAVVYLGLGDKEQALGWLEQSYQDRAGSEIAYIKVDPFLDPLRGEPRFEALVAKVFSTQKSSDPSP